MKILKLLLFLPLFVLLESCETIVTRKSIDQEEWTFRNAGKDITMQVDLVQIRTSRRRGRRVLGRQISYDYVVQASYNGGGQKQILFELPCKEDADLDVFIERLKIKRSKDRRTFAIGYKNEIVAIFSVFKNQRFVSFAPQLNIEEVKGGFKDLNLEEEPSARELILAKLDGTNVPGLTSKTCKAILVSLPTNDEINETFTQNFVRNKVIDLDESDVKAILKHHATSESWRKNTTKKLMSFRDKHDPVEFASYLYAVGGKDAIVAEDKYQMNHFRKTGDLAYFETRLKHRNVVLGKDLVAQLENEVKGKVTNTCKLGTKELDNLLSYIRFLENTDVSKPFQLFLESYQKSTCKAQNIDEIVSDFYFNSDLSSTERIDWANLVANNFKDVPKNARYSVYGHIEKDLTCQQKQGLLKKFKADIDIFDNQEIPTCD
jgi:hypothetical protein